MTPFDLLFIVVFLTTVFLLATAAVSALRDNRTRATGRLKIFAIFVGGYLGILILVSLLSPGRELRIGEDLCSDDWCLGVTGVERVPSKASMSYVVTLRVSSRARRAPQSASDAAVYVLDHRGRRYDPAPDSTATPLSVRLQPGESITTTRVFDLPLDARDPGLVVFHGAFPGCIIIGNSQSLFHKPTVTKLDPASLTTDPSTSV